MSGTITFGGLASTLDTNSIIDKLVQLQQTPMTLLQKTQSGYRSQVSALGDIASKLSALDTAVSSLGSGGVLGLKTTSTNTSFTATPGSGASAGTYSVEVDRLAVGAKAMSAGFGSTDTVTGGKLTLTVQGKTYQPPITISDGESLEDVASALRGSGAPISAVVLNDGSKRWLSVAAVSTGYPLGGAPADALTLTESSTGVKGKPLGIATTQLADNSLVKIDGISFPRTTNVVTDALPGVTLSLKAVGASIPDPGGGAPGHAAENLSLDTDADATQTKLQAFVDAYNAVLKGVQGNLTPADNTDRTQTLAGDSALRQLQSRLQGLVSKIVPGTGSVRSLADLGVKTSSKDGSLSIVSTALSSALARDPAAVNSLFSTHKAGIQDTVSSLVHTFTAPNTGLLTSREDSLTKAAKEMDDQLARMQARIDTYRETLQQQFTAMEDAVSKIKASGNFLTQQMSNSNSSSS